MANKKSDAKIMIAVLCLISLVFLNAGIMSSYWGVGYQSMMSLQPSSDANAKNPSNRMGLWKMCGNNLFTGSAMMDISKSSKRKCLDIPKDHPKMGALRSCQAMSLLGMLLVFVALVVMFVAPSYSSWCKWLLLVGGVLSLITVGVWAGELLKFNMSVQFEGKAGPSLYFVVVGGLFALLCSLLCFKQ